MRLNIAVIDTLQNSSREAEAVQEPEEDLQAVKPDDLVIKLSEFTPAV